jgi:hypothetical protein
MPEPTRDPQAGTPGAPKLVPAYTYISPPNISMNEHPVRERIEAPHVTEKRI